MNPLSLLWSGVARARATLYRRGFLQARRLDRPVISVGALEMGGSGKSPAVAMLARLLLAGGYRPAILSRGYRRRSKGPLLVSAGEGPLCPATDAGDEPAMYAREMPDVPIAVAARREEAATLVLDRTDVDVFLLDDAFQHLRVSRDLDLLMVDADRPFWQASPPPAGRLREGPEAAARADGFLVVNDPDGSCAAELARRFPDRERYALETSQPGSVPLGEAAAEPTMPPEPTLPFAGIARPERLESSLIAAGIETLPMESFPDHHWYGRDDLERLCDAARRQGAASMTTTAKDAVRLPPEPPGPEIRVWLYRLRPVAPESLLDRLRTVIEKDR